MSYLYAFIPVGIGFLYKSRIYSTIYDRLHYHYERYITLQNTVQNIHNNRSKIIIICITIGIIFQMTYMSIIDSLNNSVVKIGNQYEVRYVIGGQEYKFRFKPKRGPKQILEVLDENENDVTAMMYTYMGPMRDFHGLEYTPKSFEKEQLTFRLYDNIVKTFYANDIIRI